MRKSTTWIAWLLILLAVVPVVAAQVPPPAAAPASLVRDVPTPEALTGIATVTIRFPKDAHLATWQLAHKLAFGAEGARQLKWSYRKALTAAVEQVGETPEGKVVARTVKGLEVLIARTGEDQATTKLTLYLPEAMLKPVMPKHSLDLETSFTRTSATTQQVTTWPIRFAYAYSNPIREDRTLEVKTSYSHNKIMQKDRPSLEDENGDTIDFGDLPSRTIQDSTDAALSASYFFALVRNGRLGRTDWGIDIGNTFTSDEVNYVKSRWIPYIGTTFRISSETDLDRRFEASLKIGRNKERLIVLDPVLDEQGNQTGTTERYEDNRLANWELGFLWRTSLFRFDSFNLVVAEAKTSWSQSFDAVAASEGGDEQRERIAKAELSLAFQTPAGTGVRAGATFNWNQIPGEAGARIEDFQFTTTFSAMTRIRF